MKKVLMALAITLALVFSAAPAVSAAPAAAPASYYDVQLVKTVALKAYWDQSSYTRGLICRKWRSNPTGRFFVKLALTAYNTMSTVSMREAAKGINKAFNSVCY